MALDFVAASSQNITSTSTAIAWGIGTGNCTVCAWVNPDSFPATFAGVVGFGDNSQVQPGIFTSSTTTPNAWRISFDGTKVFDTVLAAGTWRHLCIRRTSTAAGGVQGFVDGQQELTTHQSTIAFAETSWTIGAARPNGGLPVDGKVAEVAIWNVDLTDAEISALAKGCSPRFIRPQNRLGYHPMISNELRDLDLGMTFTATGSPTISPHPRIVYPRRRVFTFKWPPGNLSGSATGFATPTANLVGSGQLAGTAAGISTPSANILGRGGLAGTAAGISTPTANILGLGSLAGTAAGISTPTANILGTGTLAGTAAGTSAPSGNVISTVAVTGTAAGVSTPTANLLGSAALAGTAGGTSTPSAAILGGGALAGIAAGTSAPTANLLGTGVLTGTAAGASTPTGLLPGADGLMGTAEGASAPSANLLGSGALAGTAGGVSTPSAALQGTGALTGTAAGTSAPSANLLGRGSLTGTAAGVSSPSASLLATGQLSGTAAGTSSPTGTLPGSNMLTGTAAGVSSPSANLLGRGSLTGTAAGSGTGNGIVLGFGSLAGTASGLGSGTANLIAIGDLAGTASGTSSPSGNLIEEDITEGFLDDVSTIEIWALPPTAVAETLAFVSQRQRIQNRLLLEVEAGPFYLARFDSNLRTLSIHTGEGDEVQPSRIYAEEVSSEIGVTRRDRTRYARERHSWTWELILEFSQAVSIEFFEKRIALKPPWLPPIPEREQEWVRLELQDSRYDHPPQQQPSTGTRATLTFDAVEGPV